MQAQAPQKIAPLIAREALATLGSLLLYPLGLSHRPRKTPRRAEQRTLVFVHGYLGNRSALMPLGGYLALQGHTQQLAYQYAPGDGIEKAARGLKAFLKNYVRGGRIDLVCHSLGGLVALCYLQEMGGARRVDRCVTLGTPHRGTYNAYWIWSKVGRELRPESALLRRLARAAEKPHGVRLLSIQGTADNIVLPRFSPGFAGEQIEVPGIGHLGILFSPLAFRHIAEALR